jgi:hypothetical protein
MNFLTSVDGSAKGRRSAKDQSRNNFPVLGIPIDSSFPRRRETSTRFRVPAFAEMTCRTGKLLLTQRTLLHLLQYLGVPDHQVFG